MRKKCAEKAAYSPGRAQHATASQPLLHCSIAAVPQGGRGGRPPVGLVPLSVDQEVRVIRRGFQSLIDTSLVTVDILAGASAIDCW